MLRSRRAERGQVLVLFVAFFSIVLLLLAYAIDQGFWYGNRRVAQKDADAAARAGAIGYLSDMSDSADAVARAQGSADDNAAQGVTVIASDDCTFSGRTISAPSLTVQVERNVPGLFSSLPLIGGDDLGVDIGAQATTCVGAAQTLYVADLSSPAPDENTLEGINVALRSDVGGRDSCFSGQTLILGEECVIWDAFNTDRAGAQRVLFNDPPADRCRQGGNPDADDIRHGVSFTCTMAPAGATCTGIWRIMSCVRSRTVGNSSSDEDDQEEVLEAVDHRLDVHQSTNCGDDGFLTAFDDAGGQVPGQDHAPGAFTFGDSDDDARVYVQTDCFDNPRIVVMPIVQGGSDGGGRGRIVRGFAMVYLTGCYHSMIDGDRDGDPEPIAVPNPEAENRGCDGDANEVDDCGQFDDATDGCWSEIRGVPIYSFVTSGALGDVDSTTRNSMLTIQTVQ
jgi:hypothetical protein